MHGGHVGGPKQLKPKEYHSFVSVLQYGRRAHTLLAALKHGMSSVIDVQVPRQKIICISGAFPNDFIARVPEVFLEPRESRKAAKTCRIK